MAKVYVVIADDYSNVLYAAYSNEAAAEQHALAYPSRIWEALEIEEKYVPSLLGYLIDLTLDGTIKIVDEDEQFKTGYYENDVIWPGDSRIKNVQHYQNDTKWIDRVEEGISLCVTAASMNEAMMLVQQKKDELWENAPSAGKSMA